MTKTVQQLRQEKLKPARDHFKSCAEYIRTCFPFEIWSMHGLNWPHWDKLRVLICNTFGVSTIDQIPDEFIDSANDFAIEMINTMFDRNIQAMKLFQQKKEEESNG